MNASTASLALPSYSSALLVSGCSVRFINTAVVSTFLLASDPFYWMKNAGRGVCDLFYLFLDSCEGGIDKQSLNIHSFKDKWAAVDCFFHSRLPSVFFVFGWFCLSTFILCDYADETQQWEFSRRWSVSYSLSNQDFVQLTRRYTQRFQRTDTFSTGGWFWD